MEAVAADVHGVKRKLTGGDEILKWAVVDGRGHFFARLEEGFGQSPVTDSTFPLRLRSAMLRSGRRSVKSTYSRPAC
jgi:hypothetical protein